MIGGLLSSRKQVRLATMGLGFGAAVFGLVPLVAPRPFCRFFGLPIVDSPAADVIVQSVSSRDLINGIGIVSAVIHGGRVGPWLISRAVADGTDAATIAIAFASGARGWRFGLLGAIAASGAVADIILYRANRSLSTSRKEP
jgi:hypothetical protein